jgi:hypothetical protein
MKGSRMNLPPARYAALPPTSIRKRHRRKGKDKKKGEGEKKNGNKNAPKTPEFDKGNK